MTRLIALKSHSPDGSKRYKKGDAYEVSENSARVLIAMGFARRDTPVESTSAPKNTYRRRDMKAEN